MAQGKSGMDKATSDIQAVVFTPRSDGDSPVFPMSLAQIPEGEETGRNRPQ
jgi:hypothetical protein